MNIDEAKQWVLSQINAKSLLCGPDNVTTKFYSNLANLVNGQWPPARPKPDAPRGEGPRKSYPIPTDETRMWFGKHKGERLADVPDDYLGWLRGQEGTSENMMIYIERRLGPLHGE